MRRAVQQLGSRQGVLVVACKNGRSVASPRMAQIGQLRLASSLRLKLPLLGETEISLDNDVYRPGVPENPGNLYAPVPAEELIHEIPPKEVHGSTAVCDGGGGALGHPRVFINLDKPGSHACGYCGLRFIKSSEHH